MAVRDGAAARGARRGRALCQRIGDGLAAARRAAGLSLREVAARVGVGHAVIARAEQGNPTTLSIDLAARIAAVVGMELAANLYPGGDPVRDRGQLALLARLRARIPEVPGWRVEVPVPIAGDLRAGDAMVAIPGGDLLIEAETHLDDIQALERRIRAKSRDLGAISVLLLVADTRHNRRVIADHPELVPAFPIATRVCLRALRRCENPGGDALVIL